MTEVSQESLQMPFLWPLDCQMSKTNLNIASWYMSERPVLLLRRDLVTTLNAKIPLPPSHFNIKVPQEEACALQAALLALAQEEILAEVPKEILQELSVEVCTKGSPGKAKTATPIQIRQWTGATIPHLKQCHLQDPWCFNPEAELPALT